MASDSHQHKLHHVPSVLRDTLREAVFGTQDGLVSTLGALTGIAAGTQNTQAVLIAGCVIIVVESLSMAAGSYLSSKSQRQYLEQMLREEEEEIRNHPEDERREIWEMYRERGYADEEIRIIEKRLMSNPRLLLEDMAHKELGICPQVFEEPLSNAVVMGAAYVCGGLIPVMPYIVWPVERAMPWSISATMVTLFIFGAAKGAMVKQSWWRNGLEMLLIAGLASIAGFAVGHFAGLWLTAGS